MKILHFTPILLGLCACSDGAAPQAAPEASGAAYVAEHEPSHEVPDTIVTGRFEIVSGCLTFRSTDDGRRYLPVLPRPARMKERGGAAPALTVNGAPIAALGQEVRLHGGPGFYGPAAPKGPSNCPADQMILSGKKE
jgi:hypothetical protein